MSLSVSIQRSSISLSSPVSSSSSRIERDALGFSYLPLSSLSLGPSLFTSYYGGLRQERETERDTEEEDDGDREVYFMGIIDILQVSLSMSIIVLIIVLIIALMYILS